MPSPCNDGRRTPRRYSLMLPPLLLSDYYSSVDYKGRKSSSSSKELRPPYYSMHFVQKGREGEGARALSTL